jgi:phage repressor protein C with HTH and peptisase S24 domain
MLRLLKISGNSLEPEYIEGDFVLVSKIPFFRSSARPGDVVAFLHHEHGTMIKQVQSISADGRSLFVVGTHPLSVDSRHFGPIASHSVLGKVIWHVKKPRPTAKQTGR